MKKSLLFCFVLSISGADDFKSLQFKGIDTKYTLLNGKEKTITIKRQRDNVCTKVAITYDNFWSANYASKDVPDVCKKIFITTRGAVQPMFHDSIKTIGEIEVLRFIKEKVNKEPNKYMLVDARGKEWYDSLTIPSAVSVPHESVKKEEFFEDEYYSSMKKLGIKIVDEKNKKYDFSNAKEIVVFCNGIWCPQSTRLIDNLFEIGYPKDKIMWYRGGLQDWLIANFTTVSLIKENK